MFRRILRLPPKAPPTTLAATRPTGNAAPSHAFRPEIQGDSSLAIIGVPASGKTVLLTRLITFMQGSMRDRLTVTSKDHATFGHIDRNGAFLKRGHWPPRNDEANLGFVPMAFTITSKGTNPHSLIATTAELSCPDFAGELFLKLFGDDELINSPEQWEERFTNPDHAEKLIAHIQKAKAAYLLVPAKTLSNDFRDLGENTHSEINGVMQLRYACANFTRWFHSVRRPQQSLSLVVTQIDTSYGHFFQRYPHLQHQDPNQAAYWDEFMRTEQPDILSHYPVAALPVTAATDRGGHPTPSMHGIKELAEHLANQLERRA